MLARDLAALDVAPVRMPVPPTPRLECAAALGALYVLEGASLGGRVIARHVADALALTPDTGLAFFCGYGDATGEMWRRFGAALEAWVARADLERIQINQRHLLSLINSVLNFSKLEAGAIQFSPTDIPLAPMLSGLDALVGPQLRAKSLQFSVRECPDGMTVRADEEKLRQILLNLLTNALKFTGEGGTIDLSCRTAGGRIEIAVRDSGRGIPPASLESIFQPFVQVDRVSQASPSKELGSDWRSAASWHSPWTAATPLPASSGMGPRLSSRFPQPGDSRSRRCSLNRQRDGREPATNSPS